MTLKVAYLVPPVWSTVKIVDFLYGIVLRFNGTAEEFSSQKRERFAHWALQAAKEDVMATEQQVKTQCSAAIKLLPLKKNDKRQSYVKKCICFIIIIIIIKEWTTC